MGAAIILVLIIVMGVLIYVTFGQERKERDSVDELEMLRTKIIQLSQRYIRLEANGNQHSRLSETKQTAVVTENMLDRLQHFEGRMQKISSSNRKSYANVLRSVIRLRKTL